LEFDDVARVVIVDLDVHQGNGNAVLFHDNPDVFTFSMHCKANYFSEVSLAFNPYAYFPPYSHANLIPPKPLSLGSAIGFGRRGFSRRRRRNLLVTAG
jgi:hypothetical protein